MYYKCRESHNFADNCPDTDEETDQSQQMYDTDKTALQILVPDLYEDLIRATSQDTMDHLNL